MALKLYHEPRAPIECRPAWRLNDSAIERDAQRFWEAEGLLGPEESRGDRLKQLCMAGYVDDQLVAVSTARIRHVDFLGVKLAMLRLSVAQAMRRLRLATVLIGHSRELLEQWSLANPHEQVMGMGTVTQTNAFEGRGGSRGMLRGSHLGFVGWTARGEQMRVAWFEHGRVPDYPPR